MHLYMNSGSQTLRVASSENWKNKAGTPPRHMLASPGLGEEGREAVVRHRGLVGGKGAVGLKTWLVIINILTIGTIINNYAST